MALISFDNSIEVAITTYLSLREDQRGREVAAEALKLIDVNNFNLKVEFLYRHTQDTGLDPPPPHKEVEVKWSHGHRNKLYHDGRGFVPDEGAMTIARDTAFWAVSVLFQCDALTIVTNQLDKSRDKRILETSRTHADLEFMQAFVEFDRAVIACLVSLGVIDRIDRRLRDGYAAWNLFVEQSATSIVFTSFADWLYPIWNQMRLGQRPQMSDREFEEKTRQIHKLTDWVASYSFSNDILPELQERFNDLLRSEVTRVRIVQKQRLVFLEVTSANGMNAGEIVTRHDLSCYVKGDYIPWQVTFGANHKDGQDLPEWQLLEFPPTERAIDNAAQFLEFCTIPVLMDFPDLVTEEAFTEYERQRPPFNPAHAYRVVQQAEDDTLKWIQEWNEKQETDAPAPTDAEIFEEEDE